MGMARATSVRAAQTSSYTSLCTYRRLSAAHVWPVLMKAPQNKSSAIACGSTSGRTMPASFPPSSRVRRFTVSAEVLMMA